MVSYHEKPAKSERAIIYPYSSVVNIILKERQQLVLLLYLLRLALPGRWLDIPPLLLARSLLLRMAALRSFLITKNFSIIWMLSATCLWKSETQLTISRRKVGQGSYRVLACQIRAPSHKRKQLMVLTLRGGCLRDNRYLRESIPKFSQRCAK